MQLPLKTAPLIGQRRAGREEVGLNRRPSQTNETELSDSSGLQTAHARNLQILLIAEKLVHILAIEAFPVST